MLMQSMVAKVAAPLCCVSTCSEPKCRGFSGACIAHAKEILIFGGGDLTGRCFAEWCGVTLATGRKWANQLNKERDEAQRRWEAGNE